MALPPLYCTVDELRDRLCLTGTERDNALLDVCKSASRWVENRTGRRFYTVSETRYYTANFPWPGAGWAWNYERPSGGLWTSQWLPIDDAMSVTAVATDEDNDGIYEVLWTPNTDYWLAPRNAALDNKPYTALHRTLATGNHVWPSWENAVAVTGAFGAAIDTPEPIHEVALIVAELYARPLLDLTIPGVQSYRAGDGLQVQMDGENIPARAWAIIQDYRQRPGSVI